MEPPSQGTQLLVLVEGKLEENVLEVVEDELERTASFTYTGSAEVSKGHGTATDC